MADNVLLIACGALARELVALTRQNQWRHLKIQCLPAELHNTPQTIPAAVTATIEKYKDEYRHIFVAYADCGTGGLLDKALAKYGIERLPGAHCYDFYAGNSVFQEISQAEPGTFYLTDFLVRHFDRLIVEGLGIDRHPELKSVYFANYRRVVYLAQTHSADLAARAREYADFLGLDYAERHTGIGNVEKILEEQAIVWRN
ncbi:MAG: DUF1638 domain-containing protein [Gammaproteobacteria bacterium]|nr:DUF1638 domain-containing protein [Gammaproteobacteria bacterium]